jgi:hypothetical protein
MFYYVHLLSGPQGIKRHVVSPTTNDNEHGGVADARFWRKAVVRGAILESAAEGKTIAAKRGSRGAPELLPTIEQAQTGPLNLVPVYNFLSGQIQASRGERVLPFTSTLRGLLADRNLALASCYVSMGAIESRRS